jgi:threonine dehydratase
MMQPPTIDDIRAAATRIEGSVIRTPMLISRTLSEIIGAEVWLKFENLQFTGAFKERGALNKLLQLDEDERARGVIAASAGNHAQAVAYHARRLGIPATIVMPATTPSIKVSQTAGHGARVVLEGAMYDDAHDKACELALEHGLVFVHPFDDPQVIAGQGTVALEMLEVVPDLEALAIPIGGGGLMSGVGLAARAIKPDIELVGVEAELYPSMKCAIEGCALPLGGDTLAEGIAVKQPGALTSAIL